MGRLMRAASQAIMELVSSARIFNGVQNVYKHHSNLLGCDMNFAVYLPDTTKPAPVLYYLSGLTCTEQNVITKSGFQRAASQHSIAVVCPDTSPRGLDLPGEGDSWDFGTGAGFYVDATKAPYDKNYKMYTYVTKELPELLKSNFVDTLDTQNASITGHSMGGHGALTLFLKNPGLYKSCSAFSPIVNPLNCPWGEKAFNGYFSGGMEDGKAHDACELVKSFPNAAQILIDQGLKDSFLENQLKSDNIVKACEGTNVSVDLRMQEGYDHSYYFIASFISDHLDFHAKYLK